MTCIPRHVAFIADGNRKWAGERGYRAGYVAGYKTAQDVIKYTFEQGVSTISVYLFSKENWQRPQDQVSFLFELMSHLFENDIGELLSFKARVVVLGDVSELPDVLQKLIAKAQEMTAGYSRTLALAINYSGRYDIVQAMREMVRSAQKGEIDADDISENVVGRYLLTSDICDPDLIIRTCEKRISNFMLWQAAYSEIYFLDKKWPDVTSQDISDALAQYSQTKRSMGR